MTLGRYRQLSFYGKMCLLLKDAALSSHNLARVQGASCVRMYPLAWVGRLYRECVSLPSTLNAEGVA